jgi:hypothetical protein
MSNLREVLFAQHTIDHNPVHEHHLTRYSASCTICLVVLDGELAVPSRFNRTAPETRYSRVEFLLQDRVT